MEKNIPGLAFPVQIVTLVNPDGSAGEPTGSGVNRSRTIPSTAGGVLVMDANATRRKFILKNDSAIVIGWSHEPNPVIGALGTFTLPVNGGYVELDRDTAPVYAIAASGTPNLNAREW